MTISTAFESAMTEHRDMRSNALENEVNALCRRLGEADRYPGSSAWAARPELPPLAAEAAGFELPVQRRGLALAPDERALLQRTAQIEHLLDEAPIGAYLVDADFCIRHVNATARPVFGDIPGLIGRNFGEVMHILWPKATANNLIEQVNRTMHTGEFCRVAEMIEKRADRELIEYYEWQVSRTELPDGKHAVVFYFLDISARFLAQAKIAESEWRLRFATQSAGLTFVELDFASSIVTTADNFEAVMGFAAYGKAVDGAVGAQHLIEHVLPADRPQVAEALRAFHDGQAAGRLDYRVMGDDQVERWITTEWYLITDKNGKPARSFATILNITDRKRSVAALHQSEQRLRVLTEASADVVYRMSPNWSEIRQLDGRNFLADSTPDNANWLQEYIYPDDQQHVLSVIAEAIRTKGLFEMEHQVRLADGSLGWTFSHAIPVLDAAGNILEWFGTASDITQKKLADAALRESEDRYRTLFNSIDEGFCVIDMLFDAAGEPVDYRFLEVNPSFEAQTGIVEATGKRMREIAPELEACWFAVYGNVALTGVPIRFENKANQLDKRWFDVFAFRIGGLDSRKVALLFTNITKRKNTEQQLVMQAAQLADQDRRKDEFLAMLSHELRNPLAPIYNAIHLLHLQNNENVAQQQGIKIIERQLGQLNRLVNELLEVSRISSGRITLRCERIAVAGLISQAVETAQPLITQRKHLLTVALPPETLWLNADASRLEQVVVNLLTNAAKYTNDGGRIDLSVRQQGEFAVLQVRDTGIGITPELLPHVFDLFTQAVRSLDRSEGGMGIGLCLVERLVGLHGGTVAAVSRPGYGSEFTVRLPLAASLLPAPGPGKPDADLVQSANPVSAKLCRVLVVDDNVDAAETLKLLLEVLGHEVAVAHEGLSALSIAPVWLPDVVLLDIGLPGLDGYELARRIRLNTLLEGVVLVALTGYGQDSDRQQAREAGFDHHLVKPADFQALQAILTSVANRRP